MHLLTPSISCSIGVRTRRPSAWAWKGMLFETPSPHFSPLTPVFRGVGGPTVYNGVLAGLEMCVRDWGCSTNDLRLTRTAPHTYRTFYSTYKNQSKTGTTPND